MYGCRYSDNDRVMEQLRSTGYSELTIPFYRFSKESDAVNAARQRAYRLAKKIGVRVTTAAGWHVLYVSVLDSKLPSLASRKRSRPDS